jgi:hypothetical protein
VLELLSIRDGSARETADHDEVAEAEAPPS